MDEGGPSQSKNALRAVSDLTTEKKIYGLDLSLSEKKFAKESESVGNHFYRHKYYNEQANRQPDMVMGRNLIRVLTIKYDIDGRII